METTFSFFIPLPLSARIQVSPKEEVTPKTILAISKKFSFLKINLAEELGVPPKKIGHYLQVALGEKVEEGTVLAIKKSLWQEKKVFAPHGGEVYALDKKTGFLTIRQEEKTKKIFSPVTGKVIKKEKGGLTLATKGEIISLINSQGKKVFAPLKDFSSSFYNLNRDYRGLILLVKRINSALINKSAALGIKGIVFYQKKGSFLKAPLTLAQISQKDFLFLKNKKHRFLIIDPQQKKAALIKITSSQ